METYAEMKRNTLRTLQVRKEKEFDEDALKAKDRTSLKIFYKEREKEEEGPSSVHVEEIVVLVSGKYTINSNITKGNTIESTEELKMPAIKSLPVSCTPRSPSILPESLHRPLPILSLDLNNMPLIHASVGGISLEDIS